MYSSKEPYLTKIIDIFQVKVKILYRFQNLTGFGVAALDSAETHTYFWRNQNKKMSPLINFSGHPACERQEVD